MARLDDLPHELMVESLRYLAPALGRIDSDLFWDYEIAYARKILKRIRSLSKRWAAFATPLLFVRISAVKKPLQPLPDQKDLSFTKFVQHVHLGARTHLIRGRSIPGGMLTTLPALQSVHLHAVDNRMFKQYARVLRVIPTLQHLTLEFRASSVRGENYGPWPVSPAEGALPSVKALHLIFGGNTGPQELLNWFPNLEELSLSRLAFDRGRHYPNVPWILARVQNRIRTLTLDDTAWTDSIVYKLERERLLRRAHSCFEKAFDTLATDTTLRSLRLGGLELQHWLAATGRRGWPANLRALTVCSCSVGMKATGIALGTLAQQLVRARPGLEVVRWSCSSRAFGAARDAPCRVCFLAIVAQKPKLKAVGIELESV